MFKSFLNYIVLFADSPIHLFVPKYLCDNLICYHINLKNGYTIGVLSFTCACGCDDDV